jgi:secreted Zn-dependent insulinase-like peptidase
VFDRRQQKAAAVQAVTQEQLMQWFDDYVNPEGQQHHALCVQVWGGTGPAPADAVAAAHQAAVSGSVVVPDQVARFKQTQSLLPSPALQLPPAAA